MIAVIQANFSKLYKEHLEKKEFVSTLIVTTSKLRNKIFTLHPNVIEETHFMDIREFIEETISGGDSCLKYKEIIFIMNTLIEELGFYINYYKDKEIRIFLQQADVNIISYLGNTLYSYNICDDVTENEITFSVNDVNKLTVIDDDNSKFIFISKEEETYFNKESISQNNIKLNNYDDIKNSSNCENISICLINSKQENKPNFNLLKIFKKIILVGNPFNYKLRIEEIGNNIKYSYKFVKTVVDIIIDKIKNSLSELEVHLNKIILIADYEKEGERFRCIIKLPLISITVTSNLCNNKKEAYIGGQVLLISELYALKVIGERFEINCQSDNIKNNYFESFIQTFYKFVYKCKYFPDVIKLKKTYIENKVKSIEREMVAKNGFIRFTHEVRLKVAEGAFKREYTQEDDSVIKLSVITEGEDDQNNFSLFLPEFCSKIKMTEFPIIMHLYKFITPPPPPTREKNKITSNYEYGILVSEKFRHFQYLDIYDTCSLNYVKSVKRITYKQLIYIEAFQVLFFKRTSGFTNKDLYQNYTFYYSAIPITELNEINFELIESIVDNFFSTNVLLTDEDRLKTYLLWNLKTKNFLLYLEEETNILLENYKTEDTGNIIKYSDIIEHSNAVELKVQTGKGLFYGVSPNDEHVQNKQLLSKEIVYVTSIPISTLEDYQIFRGNFNSFIIGGLIDSFCDLFNLTPSSLLITALTPSNSFTCQNLERLEFLGDSILKYIVSINILNNLILTLFKEDHVYVCKGEDDSEGVYVGKGEDVCICKNNALCKNISNIPNISNLSNLSNLSNISNNICNNICNVKRKKINNELNNILKLFNNSISDYLCNQYLASIVIKEKISEFIQFTPSDKYFQPPTLLDLKEVKEFKNYFGNDKTFKSNNFYKAINGNVNSTLLYKKTKSTSSDKSIKYSKLLADVYEAIIGAIYWTRKKDLTDTGKNSGKGIDCVNDFLIKTNLYKESNNIILYEYLISVINKSSGIITLNNNNKEEEEEIPEDLLGLVKVLENSFKYSFTNKKIIKIISFTVISSNIPSDIKNITDILSILGSSLLELIVTENLYENEIYSSPLYLHAIRSSYINLESMSIIMKRYGIILTNFLLNNDEISKLSDSKLSSIFYALLGGILLDLNGDLDKFKKDVYPVALEKYILDNQSQNNYKKALNEFQKN